MFRNTIRWGYGGRGSSTTILVSLIVMLFFGCWFRGRRETFCKKAPLKKVLKYSSSMPSDTPVSMAFDSLMMKELGKHKLPSLALEQRGGDCPHKLTNTQLRRYLVSVLGKDAHLPAVNIDVSVEVPCIHIHYCRGLGKSTLMFVEFVAIRSGDTVGIHYECQVMVDPLSIVWFRRRGELSSYDAYTCGGKYS